MVTLTQLDILILTGSIAIVLAIGLGVARRSANNSISYFLAGRNLGWFAIGMSLFATNISSEHFVGLAGSGAEHGLAVGNFELLAVPFLMLLGWIFAPIFLKTKIFTVPEFFGQRFNSTIRLLLSGISIAAYLLTKIFVSLIACGLVLHGVLGWDIHTSAVLLLIITGLYTIVGGMRAVVYTSIVQTFLIVAGAITLTVIGLHEVNGFSGLQANLSTGYFSLFRSLSDPDFPWTGIVFGAPILAMWYWCTDQYIVQRVLCARNVDQARSGTILAGFLKMLPMFILVVPGMVAAVLFPGISGDAAYSALLTGGLLPAGITGLVLAGVLAALMSSLSACFISISTLFTMDFYRHFQPAVDEEKLVLVGRLFTTVIVFLGVLGVPLSKLFDPQIYVHLQSVQAYISPPIAAVFLLGIFWKRANSRGALWTLVIGEALGLTRLGMAWPDWNFTLANPLLRNFVTMNFLHFAIFLFGCSVVIMVSVSLLSRTRKTALSGAAAIPGEILPALPKLLSLKRPVITGRRLDRWTSLALMALVFGLWGIFG